MAPAMKDCSVEMQIVTELSQSNKFTGKTFQAAQLTHERFLTLDHSCKIFFDVMGPSDDFKKNYPWYTSYLFLGIKFLSLSR